MKLLVNNKYIEIFKFPSYEESLIFYDNQKTINKYFIKDNIYSEYYYSCICYNSLTKEKEFIISFNSDEKEKNLNISFWNDLFIIQTDKKIFFFNNDLSIKFIIEIDFYIIGLYFINNEKLLILDEISAKIINYNGDTLINKNFDLIENYNINNEFLIINNNEKLKLF